MADELRPDERPHLGAPQVGAPRLDGSRLSGLRLSGPRLSGARVGAASRVWRVVALSSLAVAATDCTSLRRVRGPVEEPWPVQERDEIRLTLTSGALVYVKGATLVGDSVVGVNPRATAESNQRVAVHRNDIAEVAVRRRNGVLTAVAVTAGSIAALTIIAAVACAAALGSA